MDEHLSVLNAQAMSMTFILTNGSVTYKLMLNPHESDHCVPFSIHEAMHRMGTERRCLRNTCGDMPQSAVNCSTNTPGIRHATHPSASFLVTSLATGSDTPTTSLSMSCVHHARGTLLHVHFDSWMGKVALRVGKRKNSSDAQMQWCEAFSSVLWCDALSSVVSQCLCFLAQEMP